MNISGGSMAFNQDQVEGKWKEIKGDIRKKWGQLTENDVEATRGNLHSLVGVLQQKFGVAKEEATKHLNEITERYSGKVNTKIDQAKAQVKK
jgi:uncharacterized protein YjbJ (UPF0337 family)